MSAQLISTRNASVTLWWEVDIPDSSTNISVTPDDLNGQTVSFEYMTPFVGTIGNLQPGTQYEVMLIPIWGSKSGDPEFVRTYTKPAVPTLTTGTKVPMSLSGTVALDGHFDYMVISIEPDYKSLTKAYGGNFDWTFSQLVPGFEYQVSVYVYAGGHNTSAKIVHVEPILVYFDEIADKVGYDYDADKTAINIEVPYRGLVQHWLLSFDPNPSDPNLLG